MDRYEYKIVPAPTHGTKRRGAKKPEQKFALTIENVMNDMAAEGWEFQRSETLPHEHRSGLTGRTAVSQRSVLVFRRAIMSESADETEATDTPELLASNSDESAGAAPAPTPDDNFFAGGKFRQ